MLWIVLWVVLWIVLTVVFSIYIIIAWVLDSVWLYILSGALVIVSIICAYYFLQGVKEAWGDDDN